MTVLEKFREGWGRLTSKQRFRIGLALVGTLVLVWAFTLYVNRIRFGVLYSNLDGRDANTIVAALKERQVDYRLSAGGTIVEVPFNRIDEVRLALAGEGLPAGDGAGFELFDKPSFGLSDFVQNVNYRRALERELSRTIRTLDAVDSARVHLALPPESVFADERRQPSASVVVRLRSGGSLGLDRIRAITNLVASGVEGLDPARVSVIDGNGRMLSPGGDGDDMLTATQMESKRGIERGIESRLLSILEPLVGVGKARVRATVELNMTRIERVQEAYDSAGAVVRSEQKTKMKSDGGGGPGGVPGTTSNLPGGGSAAGGSSAGARNESQTTVTNFEIPKTVSTISEPIGSLARQSVAVVIDHGAATGEGGGDGDGAAASTPRTDDEMQKITELVRAAIGMDATRGDQLIVQNIPFDETALPAELGGPPITDLILKILRFASLPLAVLLVALLVIRPALTAVRSLGSSEGQPALAGGASSGIGAGGAPTVAQLQAQVQAQLDGGSGDSSLQRKLLEAVGEDPRAAALVVRSWLSDGKDTD